MAQFRVETVDYRKILADARRKQQQEANKLLEDEAFAERVMDMARRKPYHEEYRSVVEGKFGIKNLIIILHTLQILIGLFGLAGFVYDKIENVIASYAFAFAAKKINCSIVNLHSVFDTVSIKLPL